MTKKLIYDVKAVYTFMQTDLEIITRSMYNKVLKSILWAVFETQEKLANNWKQWGITALSCLASTCRSWLTASTAAPVLSGMLIAGLTDGGFKCLLKMYWQEDFKTDVVLMNYAKTFGLNFLAGAVSGGAAICLTATIAGICCASIPEAYVTHLKYVALKAMSCAIKGFAFSLASDSEKIYVDGMNITFQQSVGNAFKRTVKLGSIGIISSLLSIAVNQISGDFSTKKERNLAIAVRRNTVPVTCNLTRKVTELITETALDNAAVLGSYLTLYAKPIFKRVHSYIGQSLRRLECLLH